MSYLQFSVTDSNQTQRDARILDLEPGLSLPEIARLARAFARNGITVIRLAGGEPLLRDEVVKIVETFAHQPGIGVVAMTTDGVRLARYAESLVWAGLQRITVTLDSLHRDTYHRLTGQETLPQVTQGLKVAIQLPFQHVCVSMSVRRGVNDMELSDFLTFSRETSIEICFTELQPHAAHDPKWEEQFIPAREIRQRLGELGVVGSSPARTFLSGGGAIRVLAPVSEPNPREWLHLRISAIGRLTACQVQTEEENLRPWVAEPDLDVRVSEAIHRTTAQVQQEMVGKNGGATSS